MAEEIITKSRRSRIKDAFIGILVGIVMIIAAIVLIFLNERHGLHTMQSLVEVQRTLIPIPNVPVDQKNNLHVVYVTGLTTTKDTLKDPLLTI
ncbi:Uncharacterised protein [Legionella lansingensis]|uniref:Uncharacterized protein n=1 Tax=Legionella lansingensis TaxID=45067 RepID=A0A0W0VLN3_9GAMM|nr:hypothetical protein [Legionella lansingensis]KTD20926.1 hypothetical protein Llan_1656 [Legionella lansingensis]SNV44322.1 Uncharacterised protein [Legionella lansingensis]